MFVIPSLRLEPDASRAYATAIADAVEEWERSGFTRVQLSLSGVDRRPPDERILEEILRDIHSPIQVAGRFEGTEEIDAALAAGAEFVVLTGRALDEFDWLSSVCGRFPGQLLLTSPARERRARTRGAVRTLPLDLRDLAAEVADMPLAGIVVEFAADATIGHAELGLLEDVAEEVDFPVQVSVASPDLALLRDLEFRGIAAVLIDAAHLSAGFDGQTLARNFTD
jgi:phosphoribosylformimino-5-aminoimidazole carboxamide ribonucleotide (ProFAR) isomerase